VVVFLEDGACDAKVVELAVKRAMTRATAGRGS
jgi:hypothetical protein